MRQSSKGNIFSGLSRRHIAMIVLCVFLALVLTVMLAVTTWVETTLNKLNRVDGSNESTLSSDQLESIFNETDATSGSATGPTISGDDVTWGTEPLQQIGGEGSGLVNILLIGQDRREGEYRARSDAMILCTFNKETKTLTMTSFLRDLYVQIPGYKSHKLNSAYQVGGMSLLNETLYENFGIHIDSNVEVDFDAFSQVVDILGGVDILLTDAEASHLNTTYGWTLQAGLRTLSGEEALAYARIRAIGMDFQRTERQRNVLTAILNQCKSMSFSQFNTLLSTVLPLVTTDLSNKDIFGYAGELFPMLSGSSIVTQRIPADNMYQFANIDGLEVLLPDLDASRQLLIDTLAG